LCNEKQ
jgi:ubiquitin-conjugating enzyme E2 D